MPSDDDLVAITQSPLTWLLEEERRGDRQALSALFLSYNVNHAFFEAVALGAAQATGARLGIVGDAAVNSIDPWGTKRAGRSYLAGQAACARSFHPKVVVLTGTHRGFVAIGSGNVTMSGWHDNAELWTVFHGEKGAAPAVFHQVAEWLRQLPGKVRFGSTVPEFLGTVADELDTLEPARHDPGAQVLHNLHSGFLDQLPTGETDELALCAPFHDLGAQAVRALTQRLRPRRLTIAFQPRYTRFDGLALGALAAELEADGCVVELRADDERDRYRHGKLIEWVIDGQRFALTGSPNLSTAALLRTPTTGGNCELAVLQQIGRTRLPEGKSGGTVGLDAHRIAAAAPSSVPVLLGATATPHGLLVQLARAQAQDTLVELCRSGQAAGPWDAVGSIPAGQLEATFPVLVPGGTCVRLTVRTAEGVLRSGLFVVSDPVTVLRRPAFAGSPRASVEPIDLFTDDRLRDLFAADLVALRRDRAATVSGDGESNASGLAESAPEGWQAYLDRCTSKVGEPLIRFALGLPSTPAADDQEIDEMWPGAVEGDATEEMVDEADDDASDAVPDLRDESAQVRARYRRWATELTTAAGIGSVERLLALRLLLWTVAGHAWPRGDRSWIPLLSRALVALGRDDDLQPESEPNVGSLAAVGVAILRFHAPRSARNAENQAFTAAADAVAHLLPAAELDLVTEYAKDLGKTFPWAVSPDSVLDLAEEIVQDDPLAAAVLALAEQGLDAHSDGPRLLHVTGPFRKPEFPALKMVAACPDMQLLGALATSESGTWTLLAWRSPDLFRLDCGADGTMLWYHYRLTKMVTLQTLVYGGSYRRDLEVDHGARLRVVPEAVDVFKSIGLADLTLPMCTAVSMVRDSPASPRR